MFPLHSLTVPLRKMMIEGLITFFLSESLNWRQGVSRCIWFIWYQEGLARSMLFCKRYIETTSWLPASHAWACSFAAFPAAVWQPSKKIKPRTWLPVDRGTPTSMCVLVVYMGSFIFLNEQNNLVAEKSQIPRNKYGSSRFLKATNIQHSLSPWKKTSFPSLRNHKRRLQLDVRLVQQVTSEVRKVGNQNG